MQKGIPKQIDWLVVAGKGSQSLSLGQHETEIRKLLGNPDSTVSKLKNHYYYSYPKLGLQIDFGSRDGNVQSLYFFQNIEGYNQSPAETVEGLGPGVGKAQVSQALGSPDRINGGVKFANGHVLVESWWYKQGIQFGFNQRGVAEIMNIFDPQNVSQTSFCET